MLSAKIKSELRIRYPGLFKLLVNIRHSKVSSCVASTRKRRMLPRILSENTPYFPAIFRTRCGFGAQLSHLMGYLEFCDKNALVPMIEIQNPLYAVGEDESLFDMFFCRDHEHPVAEDRTNSSHEITTFLDYSDSRLEDHVSLHHAHDLFNKYLTIREEFIEEADRFVAENFGDEKFISIHYRGTDKYLEAQKIERGRFLDEVARIRGDNPDIAGIFVGTDEPDFLKEFQDRFRGAGFATYYLGPDLNGALPRHLSNHDGKLMGREALVTILIFARSAVCLRTCSHLSGWAKIINPALETVTVTDSCHSSVHFPDRQILATESDSRKK